jgi:hypothetical protein
MLVTGLAGAGAQTAAGLSAEELLARVDRNEAGTSSHFVGTITVEDRFGRKVTGFESFSQGTDRSLVAFTSGEEKGQKILRLRDTLYVSYPEADKPVKIQGAALKDSVAGSDFSYEDMAGDPSYSARYTAKIVGDEAVAGEPCVVLEMRARGPGLAYPLLKVWVALADFSGRRMEKYSQNERLLKTQTVLEVLHSAGRTVPSKAVMTDTMRGKSQTLFDITKAELDVRIPASKFSLEELTW